MTTGPLSRRRFLRRSVALAIFPGAPTVALAAITVRPGALPDKDARLLRLCAKAVELNKEQETIYALPEEQWGPFEDDFCERQRVIHQAIILTPATTLDGLRAKARAITDSCWSGDDNDFEDFIQYGGPATTDTMLLWSIFRDLAGKPHDPTKHGRPKYSAKSAFSEGS